MKIVKKKYLHSLKQIFAYIFNFFPNYFGIPVPGLFFPLPGDKKRLSLRIWIIITATHFTCVHRQLLDTRILPASRNFWTRRLIFVILNLYSQGILIQLVGDFDWNHRNVKPKKSTLGFYLGEEEVEVCRSLSHKPATNYQKNIENGVR